MAEVRSQRSEDRACLPSVWRGQMSELARRHFGGVRRSEDGGKDEHRTSNAQH